MDIKDIQKATALYKELSEHLKSLEDGSIFHQTKNACEAVSCLENASSDVEKERLIRIYFRLLFPSRGGLSDIVIWDEDFEKRKALNEAIRSIEKELGKIIIS